MPISQQDRDTQAKISIDRLRLIVQLQKELIAKQNTIN